LSQKRERSDDIRQMPHGLPGVETRMPVTFTEIVSPDGDGAERFVEVFSAAPARINALSKKGIIAPGFDADLVMVDPSETRTITSGALHMGTDFSPFEGKTVRGWPRLVVAAGKVVLDENGFHDPGPTGRFIEQSGFKEALSHQGGLRPAISL
ncbi:MAG: amidohydrolase family protein, partial [Actinomycetes bacterium]